MEIKFVGTGGALEPHKGNASAIVEHNGARVLVDCGYATLERLIAKNLVDDLDYVLITHLHGDHVGSLSTLLGYRDIITQKSLPILYATDDHKAEIHEFLTITWEDKRAHYVPLKELPWIGFIDTFGLHVSEKQTFSYHFTDGNNIIFYSGDIGKIESVEDFLAEHAEKNIKVFLDINKKDGFSHVYYKTAQDKLKDYDVYGYHCDKATMPSDLTLPLVEDYPELNYG